MWHYVYILKNERGYQYVGLTDNLEKRLVKHNEGAVSSTSKYRPWTIVHFTAFPTREQAAQFEKYLKSGSGTIFRYRHLAPKNEE
jgi:putative endonuclease